jgi:hypothetical protein
MIFEEQFEEVDTFEAYFKNSINKKGVLIIPYINVGVSCHPLNPAKELLYIDKSYIVCINFCINKINGELIDDCIGWEQSGHKIIGLSGIDLSKNKHTEQKILCEKAFLQILPESKIRKDFWVPLKTPNFLSNMDANEVEMFFSHKLLPGNLKKLCT